MKEIKRYKLKKKKIYKKEVQTTNYKVNKSQGYNVEHREYSQ